MNKKILASIFFIGILALAMGWGTSSYFSDTEKSTGNVFTAGTLHTQLSNDGSSWHDDVATTWVSPSNWAPGEYFESTLYMRDSGSIGVKYIAVKGENLDNYTFGNHIFLKTIIYTEEGHAYNITDSVILHYGMDVSGDGNITLSEFVTWCNTPHSMLFSTGAWKSGSDYLQPSYGNTQYLTLGFEFDPAADNGYQGSTAHFDLRIGAFQTYDIIPAWFATVSHGYN